MRVTTPSIKPRKYLMLLSLHGLIRGHELELGRDADTGGQIKYVVDLAKALGEHTDVARVDLVTRRICDASVSSDYAEEIELLSDTARIVRIAAGPDDYLPKEQLWDYLESFTDNLVNWLNTQPRFPDLVHSHYADAGSVGVRLANFLGVPLLHTGHSLGRDKRKRLLAKGVTRDNIERVYNIRQRINAEEDVLANAALVIASTANEIDEQYGLYTYYDPSKMVVIPPGTDLEQFHPPDAEAQIPFQTQLHKFYTHPNRPLILALSRPDERKNILTLIEAYGSSAQLREQANLLIVAGTRDDVRDMDPGARTVLTNILLLLDVYDLYGKMAMPKQHSADDVPDIYRLAAASGGVFVNPALTEPFGLTLLEAAASGLPVVATENGGPVDILANCHNGLLVDPLDAQAMAAAIAQLLNDAGQWQQASMQGIAGVKAHYSWHAHVTSYLEHIAGLEADYRQIPREPIIRSDNLPYRDRGIFTDLDQSLLGDPEALQELIQVLNAQKKSVSFGVVTGRRLDSALALIKKHGIPLPDILISSLGTQIHYRQSLVKDVFWTEHIDHHWNRDRIERSLATLPGLKKQPPMEQTPFKLSYFYDAALAPDVTSIIDLLRSKDLTANVMLSFGQFLDIVPTRASKGQALRYVAQRLEIPLEQMLVSGGSGSDEDMLLGNTQGVIVANRHHEELSHLTGTEQQIFFAQRAYAGGILEAITHYDFFRKDTAQAPV